MTDDVTRLRAAITAAQAAREDAVREHAVAAARVKDTADAIREEFGIEPAEAPALIESMQADLAREVTRVKELLEAAGE